MIELEKSTHDNANGLDYTLVNDHYLPNLTVAAPAEQHPTGRWGRLHKKYLEEHHPVRYNQLVLSGELGSYLSSLDKQADEQLPLIIRQMQDAEGVTEALKAENQLEWVRRMNSIRSQVPKKSFRKNRSSSKEVPTMTVLKLMLKLAVLPLYLLLILVRWTGIFLTTFSSMVTNLLAGMFFFTALACWVMRLADGGEVLKMLITGFAVFTLPYIAMALIAKISISVMNSGIFSNPEFP